MQATSQRAISVSDGMHATCSFVGHRDLSAAYLDLNRFDATRSDRLVSNGIHNDREAGA